MASCSIDAVYLGEYREEDRAMETGAFDLPGDAVMGIWTRK
jgi:hypothetical protein